MVNDLKIIGLIGGLGVAGSIMQFGSQFLLGLALSEADFGLLTVLFNLSSLLAPIAIMGCRNILLSEATIPGTNFHNQFNLFSLHCKYFCICIFSLGIFSYVLGLKIEIMWSFFFVSSWLLIISLSEICAAASQAVEQYFRSNLLSLFPHTIKFSIAVLFFIGVFPSVLDISVLALIVLPLAVIVGYWIGPNFGGTGDGPRFFEVLKPGSAYILIHFSQIAYFRLSLILLILILANDLVGEIAMIQLIFTSLVLLPNMLSQRFFQGKWHQANRENRWSLLKYQIFVGGVVNFCLCCVLILFGEDIMADFFGEKFTDAKASLNILVPVVMLRTFILPLVACCNRKLMKWRLSVVLMIGACINSTACLMFVPFFGVAGFLYVLVVTEILLLAVLGREFLYVWR